MPLVTVCAAVSSFVHVTVFPVVIVTELGMKHSSVDSHPGRDEPAGIETIVSVSTGTSTGCVSTGSSGMVGACSAGISVGTSTGTSSGALVSSGITGVSLGICSGITEFGSVAVAPFASLSPDSSPTNSNDAVIHG